MIAPALHTNFTYLSTAVNSLRIQTVILFTFLLLLKRCCNYGISGKKNYGCSRMLLLCSTTTSYTVCSVSISIASRNSTNVRYVAQGDEENGLELSQCSAALKKSAQGFRAAYPTCKLDGKKDVACFCSAFRYLYFFSTTALKIALHTA